MAEDFYEDVARERAAQRTVAQSQAEEEYRIQQERLKRAVAAYDALWERLLKVVLDDLATLNNGIWRKQPETQIARDVTSINEFSCRRRHGPVTYALRFVRIPSEELRYIERIEQLRVDFALEHARRLSGQLQVHVGDGDSTYIWGGPRVVESVGKTIFQFTPGQPIDVEEFVRYLLSAAI